MRMFLAIGIALAMACGSNDGGSGGGGGGAADVKWPNNPSGAPVVIDFVEMMTKGDKPAAKLRLFNFTEKTVTRVYAVLGYIDAGGKQIKDFPMTWSGPALLGSKEHKEKIDSGFVPAETTRVTATVKEVSFADGSKWP